ncbi:MAG: penicillin-binding protein activator LpoB [Planctomycetota bacterium]|nr:penicillin-binding protein activator LpoB [Planctomycetota bacterium]MEC8512842.1 penicillin-binding protein activator LpoB [Planctomycetota bacterium]
MTIRTTLLAAATLLLGSGCSSLGYGDPDATETVTIEFGSTDLQTFASTMAESLLASPNLSFMDTSAKGDDKRVIAVQGGIANETREHINTAQILREMNETIVNSGRMRLVAGAENNGQDLIAERVRFDQDTGRVRADMAKEFGKQLGADVVIYGALSDIYKERGRSIESLGSKRKDLFYQFSMSAVNVETGEILWTKTTDIRKKETVSLFGRG